MVKISIHSILERFQKSQFDIEKDVSFRPSTNFGQRKKPVPRSGIKSCTFGTSFRGSKAFGKIQET